MRITRKQTYSALAGIGILLGSAGFAGAATGGTPAPNVPAAQQQAAPAAERERAEGKEAADGQERDEPSYTASITVTDTSEPVNEADEDAKLAALATVTPDAAGKAALAAHPGEVTAVQLENESGNVVYSVIVDTTQGGIDVKVDAGNAKILDSETEDGDGETYDSAADGEQDRTGEAPGTEAADD